MGKRRKQPRPKIINFEKENEFRVGPSEEEILKDAERIGEEVEKADSSLKIISEKIANTFSEIITLALKSSSDEIEEEKIYNLQDKFIELEQTHTNLSLKIVSLKKDLLRNKFFLGILEEEDFLQ